MRRSVRLGETRRVVRLGLDAGEDLVDTLGETGELLGGETARGFGDGRSALAASPAVSM